MTLSEEIDRFDSNMDKLQAVAPKLTDEQTEEQILKAIEQAKRIGRMMRDERDRKDL